MFLSSLLHVFSFQGCSMNSHVQTTGIGTSPGWRRGSRSFVSRHRQGHGDSWCRYAKFQLGYIRGVFWIVFCLFVLGCAVLPFFFSRVVSTGQPFKSLYDVCLFVYLPIYLSVNPPPPTRMKSRKAASLDFARGCCLMFGSSAVGWETCGGCFVTHSASNKPRINLSSLPSFLECTQLRTFVLQAVKQISKKRQKKKTNKNKTKQNNHQIAVQLNSSKETWTRPLTFLFRVSRSLAWQGVFTITSDHHDWLSFRAVPRCLRNRIQVPTKSWSAAVRSLQWGRQRLRFQTKIFGTTLDNVRTSLVSSYTIGKALRALLLATT